MSEQEKLASSSATTMKEPEGADANADGEGLAALKHADDALLAKLGYQSVFKREFSVSLIKVLDLSMIYRALTEEMDVSSTVIRDDRVRVLHNGGRCLGVIDYVVPPCVGWVLFCSFVGLFL